jgi:hypothetical protein
MKFTRGTNETIYVLETTSDTELVFGGIYVNFYLNSEILIKPIVQQYYEHKMNVNRVSSDCFIVEGTTFGLRNVVTYTPTSITIKLLNPKLSARFSFENMAQYLPPVDDNKWTTGDITFIIAIKNVATYFWTLINEDRVPPFDNESFRWSNYILAFYIGCDGDPYEFYETRYVHGHRFKLSYSGGNDMSIDRGPFFACGRSLFYACVRWWQALWKRKFTQVLKEIEFAPGISVNYCKARKRFSSFQRAELLAS